MSDEDQGQEFEGVYTVAPSPITGIGFYPTKISKGGFVLDVKAHRDDR